MLPPLESDSYGQFDAGDVRVNENMLLSTFHTIFMR